MAADVNIESYLRTLRQRLGHRHDADDLLAEVEDHLHMAVGRGGDEAAAVARFGDADVVAAALEEANGPPAVPTRFTRTAGTAAIVGTLGWLVLPLAWWLSVRLDRTRDWYDGPQRLWLFGVAGLACGAATTLLLVLGLRRRHALDGPLTLLGSALVGAGGLVAVVVGWVVPLWAGLIAVGTLLVGAASLRRRVVPVVPTLLWIAAWPAGLATYLTLVSMEFGHVDEYGDRLEAMVVGLAVTGVVVSLGAVGLGVVLARETPVEPVAKATADAAPPPLATP